MTRVQLSTRSFSLEDLQSEPAKYTHWFERARAEAGEASCLCRAAGPALRLVIRRRDGLFHLAGWPLDGDAHSEFCFFHKTPQKWSGRGLYANGAFKDRDDGSIDIKTKFPLKVRTGERSPRAAHAPPHAALKERPKAVGLLGLLHDLWEGASLNRWSTGWSRNWSRCRWQLTQIERRVDGVPLLDCLHIVQAWEQDRKAQIESAMAAFRARLVEAHGFRHRGFVLGELKQYSPTKHGFRIDLRHQNTAYFASKELVEATEKSARAVMAARQNPDARTIVMMLIEQTDSGNLRVVDIALMLTTRTYIPCESSFELQMADALVAAGRSFTKPLCYDGVAENFPDFRLVDTQPHTVVEVYGMIGNPTYDKRKAEKQASYSASRTPVIAWDTRQPLPDIRKLS